MPSPEGLALLWPQLRHLPYSLEGKNLTFFFHKGGTCPNAIPLGAPLFPGTHIVSHCVPQVCYVSLPWSLPVY